MRFHDAQTRMAGVIREGGLKQSVGMSQSPQRMWKSLVVLNEGGIITIDSQPGDSPDERAYIDGFMMEPHAMRYVELLNRESDMVAMILRPGSRWLESNIVLTRSGIAGKRTGETRLPLYMDRKTYSHLKSSFREQGGGAGIDTDIKAVLVCTFDPRWGRDAMSRGGLIKCMKRAINGSTLMHLLHA